MKTQCVKRYALKALRSILTSSARGHITSTAVWICVVVAFHAVGSSFGFGRINHHVTRQFIYFTRLENLVTRISVLLNIIVN